jgi:uncharacterized OB-fold protein
VTMTQPEAGTAGSPEGRRAPEKPLPRPDNKQLTAPFWQATKRHELVMQRCNKCSNWIFYPREQCPICFSQDLGWEKVSGNGRVYAVTIIHQPGNAAFEPDVPYAFAIVQLDEGVRMPTNIVGCPWEDVKIDMPVTVEFDDVTPEWTLVKFKPR